MIKIFSIIMCLLIVVVLSECGNNPQNKFEGKTYYAEPLDGSDSFLLEFQDEQYVKLMYPQLNNAGEVGMYSISDEKHDGMYHVSLNIDELGHDDYLFDEKNMQLIGVDPDNLKLEEVYYDNYDLQLGEYNHLYYFRNRYNISRTYVRCKK